MASSTGMLLTGYVGKGTRGDMQCFTSPPSWKCTAVNTSLFSFTFEILPSANFWGCFQEIFNLLNSPRSSSKLATVIHQIRGGADKSLARLTSWCRRTESIVSLERGVYLCAELQAFSCNRGWKEACQATRTISTTSRRELSLSFFFPCKARCWRKFTPFWQKH